MITIGGGPRGAGQGKVVIRLEAVMNRALFLVNCDWI